MFDKMVISPIRVQSPIDNITVQTIQEEIPANITRTNDNSHFINIRNDGAEAKQIFSMSPYLVVRTKMEWYTQDYPRPHEAYRIINYIRDIRVLNISHTFDKNLIIEYQFISEERNEY